MICCYRDQQEQDEYYAGHCGLFQLQVKLPQSDTPVQVRVGIHTVSLS